MDRGANGSVQVACSTSEQGPHTAHTALHDAFQSTAPSGVKSSHCSRLLIGHQDGHAVGDLDAKKYSALAGDYSIAGDRRLGNSIFDSQKANDARVDLPQCNQRRQRPESAGCLLKEQAAVALNRLASIRWRESKIQLCAAVDIGESAGAGAESVNEVRQRAQLVGLQNLDFLRGWRA